MVHSKSSETMKKKEGKVKRVRAEYIKIAKIRKRKVK